MSRKNINARAKLLEKSHAEYLTEHGIPAERIQRLDFGKSDTDIKIIGHPELKVDCKSKQKSSHYSLFMEIEGKYCKKPGDKMIMPLRLKQKKRSLVTIDDEFFCELLLLYIENKKKNAN